MKRKFIFYYIGLMLLTIGFTSCVDEKDFDFGKLTPITLNPNIKLNKLVSQEINLNDFFNIDSIKNIKVITINDAEGGDYLEFVYSFDTTLIPEIPEISINPLKIILPTINTGGLTYTGSYYYPDISQNMLLASIDFPTWENGQRVDSINFEEGNIDISVTSNIDYPAKMYIECSEIINRATNKPYKDSINLSTTKNRKSNGQNLIDLSKYKIVLSNNKIDFKYRLFIAVNGTMQNYDVSLNFSFSSLKFKTLYGKLGNDSLAFSSVHDIEFFKPSAIGDIFEGGHFALEKLFINFTTETNSGIPSKLEMSKLGAYDKEDVFHNASLGNVVLGINPPASLGLIGSNTQRVDFNTSVLNLPPQKFEFSGNLIINPDGSDGFLPNNPYVKINAEMHIPFKGKINDLLHNVDFYNDLYKENTNSDDFINYINSATIYLDLSNYFPISVGAELYGVDTNDTEIGSILLFNQGIDNIVINGANVDNNGNVISPAKKQTTISANKTNIDILKKSKKLRLKLKLNTSSDNTNTQPFIRFQRENKIIINAGIDLKTNITIKK